MEEEKKRQEEEMGEEERVRGEEGVKRISGWRQVM